MRSNMRLPQTFVCALRRYQLLPSRHILSVNVAAQTMQLFQRAKDQSRNGQGPQFDCRKNYLISTSAYGSGQALNSHQTPLGLHRVASKVGGGQPIGTVFRSRQPVGLSWQGLPNAPIVHRILWLEGLEAGYNLGGSVDSFSRYIYIHGFGDETTLGRPVSEGCIHMAAKDLIPLFDILPIGTLVWIGR